MTVLEGFALAIVLLLSMYGCACLSTGVVRAIWRPKNTALTLVLTLADNAPNAEQQVQYARLLSKDMRIPLVVDGLDECEETSHLVSVMLHE